jgi:hypothetical protein
VLQSPFEAAAPPALDRSSPHLRSLVPATIGLSRRRGKCRRSPPGTSRAGIGTGGTERRRPCALSHRSPRRNR